MNRGVASRESVPALGLIAAVLATVIACVVVFPERPAPAGALMVPGLVMTIGIMFVPILRLLGGSHDLMRAENFVCLGYVFWLLLDLVQGSYPMDEASDRALQLALAAVGLSAASMWLGMTGRGWRVPRWLTEVSQQELGTQTIERLIPVCFVLGMFNYAYSVDFDIPVMFSYLGGSRWSAPWVRGQLGGWSAFVDQMPYFGYVLPSLTALLISRRGLWSPGSAFAVACSIVMLAFLSQSGSRRIIGVTCGAALLVWVQANPGVKLKNLAIVAAGAIAMAWASQFIFSIRSEGLEVYRKSNGQLEYLQVDDNFLRLAQIIELVPSAHPHVGSQQLIYTAVRPVPRVFWPNKPIDPGFDLPTFLGLRGVSLTMSIVGEWYLSFGWLSIAIGGWLHGRLAKMADALLDASHHENPVVYGLMVMVLVAGQRSMLDLVIMSYALVAWWAITRLIARGQG